MQQILDRIGALGYPITAQNFNMLHNEQMVDFYQKIKSGKDAEIAAFLVDTYGSLVECAFKYQSGKLFITQLDASWNSSKQLFVSDDDFGYIDKFKMTDNGYFLYHAKCAKSYQDSSGGFRVRPLPSEDYALYKKYIEPVGYLGNNLFVTTWIRRPLHGSISMICFNTFTIWNIGKARTIRHPIRMLRAPVEVFFPPYQQRIKV